MSGRAITEGDKLSWLRIAQSWMQMIQKHSPTAEQSFDVETEAQDTHQKRSDEAH